MSLVPETWELLAHSKEGGLPVAIILRIKHYEKDRDTVWKLVKYHDGWRSVGQWVSRGFWREFPEKRGVKLSHSKIDQTLLRFASQRRNP